MAHLLWCNDDNTVQTLRYNLGEFLMCMLLHDSIVKLQKDHIHSKVPNYKQSDPLYLG